MRRAIVIVVFAAMAFSGGAGAVGERSSSSTGKVLVVVEPNVRVDLAENPAPVRHQTGDVSVTLTFLVEANQQSLSLFVEASDLFKGDDPTGTSVSPVPLAAGVPAAIEPEHARPVSFASGLAPWGGAGSPIGAFPTRRSASILFESSQNNHFSQAVDVTVTWNQNDLEKPQGQYGGRVRLTAVLQQEGPGGQGY